MFPLAAGSIPEQLEASHLPLDESFPGTQDIELDGVPIDTDGLTAGTIELIAISQSTGGSSLAVLRGRNIVLRGTIKVLGSRPLVVIGQTIEVAANLDVSADGAVGGPAASGDGGTIGRHTPSGGTAGADGGGGGGGFGAAGGGGGDVCPLDAIMIGEGTGGEGAPELGDIELTMLQGGTPGGAGVQDASNNGEVDCGADARGGAGGGAVQLSALDSISIMGVIDAGGGGGEGGVACSGPSAGAGAGGGAGGAVFLEAPTIVVSGTIGANGGGGGAGGDTVNGFAVGALGSDGNITGGGVGGVSTLRGGGGGNGGFGDVPATPGTPICSGQAGGGGGGVGRIVLHGANIMIDGVISPPPVILSR